jgi:hypothetical protein
MLIGGCDPGLTGAIAFYDSDSHAIVAMVGMPALRLAKGKGSRREISPSTLVTLLWQEVGGLRPLVRQMFIERVSASPQMGVTSAFQFGRGYGLIEGIIAAIEWPIEYVTAAKWKKALNVPADKDDARARACHLLPRNADLWTPKRGVFDAQQASGRAEAALIALYGARTLALQSSA